VSELQITRRRLAHNTLLSFGANICSLAAGIALVPLMIHHFGVELFGVYTVTWVLLANLGWLDLGLSRATGQYVARELAVGTKDTAAVWAWTAILTQIVLGSVGTVVVWFAAPSLVDLLGVSNSARDIAILSFRLFGFALPLEFAIQSLMGVLQAAQRFGLWSLLSLVGSVAMYAAALIAIVTGHDYAFALYLFVGFRILTTFIVFLTANRVVPLLRRFRMAFGTDAVFSRRLAELLRFGGWMAAGALLGIAVLYSGQWIVGILLTVSVVPFYSVPFSLQGRLIFIPLSIIGPFAAAFVALGARGDRETIERYLIGASRYLFYAVVPIFFLLFVGAHEILSLWISDDFAQKSSIAMEILLLGLVPALLAPLPAALLNSLGRPDLLPKLYVVELPVNVAVVFLLTNEFGVVGAAWAFVIRSVVEFAVIWWVVAYTLPLSTAGRALARRVSLQAAPMFAVVAALAIALRDSRLDDPGSVLAVLGVLAAYVVALVTIVFDTGDWDFLRAVVRREAAPMPQPDEFAS